VRLGKSLAEVRAMPQADLIEWMAFYAYEAWAASKEK
jgi:hypothetical protein